MLERKSQELDGLPQTALVLKALLGAERHKEDPLSEIRSLARTAGLEVADCLVQRLDRPHGPTYLGKGKLEEAARRAEELDVDFVVADGDLTPAQERNLEQVTRRTVIDRSELIMDIFAQRARTHQAQLQVELAQLRYTAPRLKRLWTHLSRYEGGIGMRGPGETQLETDKRLIARRIQKLTRELKRIERRKESALLGRRREFVVALVGYTNAGKSTLLNRLTDSNELVEDRLFATLDTRVRRWQLEPHRHVLLTDTVGFIHDLPHHLVASFHATLTETLHADLLFHVVDSSSSDAPWQTETVRHVLHQLGASDKPTWLVLNKWDSVPPEKLIDAQALQFEPKRVRSSQRSAQTRLAEEGRTCFKISALTGAGVGGLRAALLAHLASRDQELEITVPHRRSDVIAYLRENGRVSRAHYGTDAVRIRVSLSPARAARLRRLFPEGFPEDGDGEE